MGHVASAVAAVEGTRRAAILERLVQGPPTGADLRRGAVSCWTRSSGRPFVAHAGDGLL